MLGASIAAHFCDVSTQQKEARYYFIVVLSAAIVVARAPVFLFVSIKAALYLH
jgi:hypothetical protein